MRRARHPLVIAAAAIAVLVGAPVAWYLGSPVFLRTQLNEPPVVAIEPIGDDARAGASPGAEPTASLATPATAGSAGRGSAVPGASGEGASAIAPWTPAAPRTGRFAGTDDFHFGRGTALLREVEPGRWVVRLEAFSVRNGPDLYVVLSPDRKGYAAGAIEVGRLRATDGSFNMRVPEGTDVSDVASVLIWCKQFSHLFAVAPLDG